MRQILFYDTETTGIPRWDLPADAPEQPRMVDIGAVLCEEKDGRVIGIFEAIVKPDGWTVHPQAAAIHGITTEIAAASGIPIAEALDQFDRLVAQAQLLACFNLRFDEKILRGERRRLGRPDGFGTIPVFCCMRGAAPVCKLERTTKQKKYDIGQYKTPKLEEAVRAILNREHVGAHRAMADAIAASEIYFACRHLPEFIKEGGKFKSNEEQGKI